MLPVFLLVRYVVDDVDGARHEAKEDESNGCAGQRGDLEQLLIEDQGREHEAVLDPLMGTHGLDESPQHAVYHTAVQPLGQTTARR